MKTQKITPVFIIFMTIILLIQTEATLSQTKPLILISKDKNQSIAKWLLNIDSTVNVRVCYGLHDKELDKLLGTASGIIIGGGEDVNPLLYKKPEYAGYCGKPDNYRDSLEIVMIRYAMEHKIPLLAICRGIQILNVTNGGTLIPDIPSFKKSNTEHDSKSDSAHLIRVNDNSWLKNSFSLVMARVNSRHHQAVDKVAEGFSIAAVSEDGIIESIEAVDKVKYPFIIGIQWHPENLRNSFSKSLGMLFLQKCGY